MNDNISTMKTLSDMYEDWFLDYASYVILERAVPKADDGLKPVQRRILHSLRNIHDSRYHKVANMILQLFNQVMMVEIMSLFHCLLSSLYY